MIKTVVTRSALFVLVALVGVGCVTQRRSVTNYYVLEFDATALERARSSAEAGEAEVDPDSAAGVIVEEAEIAPMFDRRQLLQRREGPVVRYLSSHLWAVSPSRAFGEFVRDGVGRLGFFEEITFGRNARGRYEIQTRIDALTHYCCTEPVSGEVAGELTLVEVASGEELLRHEFSQRRELADEQARIFVEAITEVLSAELATFLVEVPEAVSHAGGSGQLVD